MGFYAVNTGRAHGQSATSDPQSPTLKHSLIARCLSAPQSAVIGLTHEETPLILSQDQNGARTLTVGRQQMPAPFRFEAPVLRTAPALSGDPGYFFLSDTSGNERFRLGFQPLNRPWGDGRLWISEEGARVAMPISIGDPQAVIYTSTAARGPVWGLLENRLDGQPPIILSQQAGAWQPLDASPDGRYILLQEVFGLYDRVLYILDRKTRLKQSLFLGTRPVALRDAVLADNPKQVLAIATGADGKGYLLSADWHDGRVKIFHQFDWPLDDMALSANGRWLALLENIAGRSKIHLFDLKSETPTIPALTKASSGRIASIFVGDDASLSYTENVPGQAPIARIESSYQSNAAPMCGVTRFKDFTITRSAPVAGRDTLPGFVIEPTGIKGPMPVILAFHGGPEGQFRANSYPQLHALAQSLGAAIIMPNIAGSTGYGLAYSAADDGKKRILIDGELSLIFDWIASQDHLDETRVATYGASYGGYMALYAAAKFPDMTSGAISVVGISHLPSFLTETPQTRRSLRRAEYGDERDKKMMRTLADLSPLTHADKIDAPILLIHGLNDARVPVNQSLKMADALKAQAKPVSLMILEDEGHIIRQLGTRIQVTEAIVSFLSPLLSKKDLSSAR